MTKKTILWLIVGAIGGFVIYKIVSATPEEMETYFCTLEEYNAFLNDFEGTPEEFLTCCQEVSNLIGEYEGCPVSFYGSYDSGTDMVYLECRSNCNGSGYILFDDTFTWTTREHIFGRPSGHFEYC